MGLGTMQIAGRVLAAFLIISAAAVSPATAGPVTLTGEVTYRERLALPSNAVLRVQLVDTGASTSAAPSGRRRRSHRAARCR